MGGWLGRSIVPFFSALIVLTNVQRVSAEMPSPHRTDVQLAGFYELALRGGGGGRSETEIIPTVRLNGIVRGEGRIDARFSVRRNKTWKSSFRRDGREITDSIDPVLLQGALALGKAWRKNGTHYPSAASIIRRTLTLSFPGRIKGSRRTRQRIYTLRISMDGSLRVSARVSSVPAFIVQKAACSSESTGSNSALSSIVPPLAAAQSAAADSQQIASIVTLSTDADAEWYARYGADSNAVIASIVNAAEVIYDRQLGVRFRIVRQHVYTGTSPYASTDAGTLLSSFANNPENFNNLGINRTTFPADVALHHLFTGKDLDGSVVGIGYIGVLCAVPDMSYGLTQRYLETVTPGIFAHEIGHNFGASHDFTDPSGLMYPSISIPPSDHFSVQTLTEIQSHLQTFNSCLLHEAVAPMPTDTPSTPENVPVIPEDPSGATGVDPANARLYVLKRRIGTPAWPVVRLYGRLTTNGGLPYASTPIRLIAGGTVVAESSTETDGRYEFFVRVSIPAGRRVGVVVEADDGSVRSNQLSLGKTVARATSRRRRS